MPRHIANSHGTGPDTAQTLQGLTFLEDKIFPDKLTLFTFLNH